MNYSQTAPSKYYNNQQPNNKLPQLMMPHSNRILPRVSLQQTI